jgi:hypothetical protein
VPAEDGLRLDQDEGRAPLILEPRQADPEGPLNRSEPGPLGFSVENGELLTEGEILQSQLRTVPEEGAEEQEDDSEDRHRDLPGRALLAACGEAGSITGTDPKAKRGKAG